MKPVPKQSSNLSISLLLVATLGLTWLLRMNFWGQPLQLDEGVYSYIGWGMFEGLVPYRDVFDHKPPGIYLLYALAFLLFRPADLSIKIFATIYTLGTILVVFLLAVEWPAKRPGAWLGCFLRSFLVAPKSRVGGQYGNIHGPALCPCCLFSPMGCGDW